MDSLYFIVHILNAGAQVSQDVDIDVNLYFYLYNFHMTVLDH